MNREIAAITSGISVSLKELIDLRCQAAHPSITANSRASHHTGQSPSLLRGRGIDFESTREYQAGDDIRSMAWRVTARSLKPHVKIYHEEKEKPVWLAVDLSPSMYFGTRCMFKSVRSIKHAALSGWQYLLEHERIGAVIGANPKILAYPPQSGERSYMRILNSLAECSKYNAVSENNNLHDVLLALQQQVRSGNVVSIISDFFHFDEPSKKILLYLAQRTQVEMIFVYDPFEAEAPPPFQYVLTNGREKILFNMKNKNNRHNYHHQFQFKQNDLIAFTRKHNIAFKMLCTRENLKA